MTFLYLTLVFNYGFCYGANIIFFQRHGFLKFVFIYISIIKLFKCMCIQLRNILVLKKVTSKLKVFHLNGTK